MCGIQQALSAMDNYVSRLSDPVVVTWPGIIPPVLESTPLKSGTVRLSWQPSYATKGISIKQCVVSKFISCCLAAILIYQT